MKILLFLKKYFNIIFLTFCTNRKIKISRIGYIIKNLENLTQLIFIILYITTFYWRTTVFQSRNFKCIIDK